MHFVNADGGIHRQGARARNILGLRSWHCSHHASLCWTQLSRQSIRVRLVWQRLALRVMQGKLVACALSYARNKTHPQAAVRHTLQSVGLVIPIVEVANHGHTARTRRPQHEAHTILTRVVVQARA